MGFFDRPKKTISDREFRQIKENLHGAHDWSSSQVGKFESIFHGEMSEKGAMHKGLDKEEATRMLDWMKDNKHAHGFTDHHIETMREEFDKHFDD